MDALNALLRRKGAGQAEIRSEHESLFNCRGRKRGKETLNVSVL